MSSQKRSTCVDSEEPVFEFVLGRSSSESLIHRKATAPRIKSGLREKGSCVFYEGNGNEMTPRGRACCGSGLRVNCSWWGGRYVEDIVGTFSRWVDGPGFRLGVSLGCFSKVVIEGTFTCHGNQSPPQLQPPYDMLKCWSFLQRGSPNDSIFIVKYGWEKGTIQVAKQKGSAKHYQMPTSPRTPLSTACSVSMFN
eukprot:1182784-Prorocentrum_minimum.AAC.1